jgi:hypothetical protein
VVPFLGVVRLFLLTRDRQVLDTRMELGFGSAHVPGALSIWEEGLPGFAGWFLSYDKPILLVTEADDTLRAVRHLIHLGFDKPDCGIGRTDSLEFDHLSY